jgi:hypothetical protein
MLYFNRELRKDKYLKGVLKMIKVFIPTEKRKVNKKILARGFWRNEAGKVFYDYLSIKEWKLSIADLSGFNSFRDYLDTLKAGYNQEAIFYKNGNIGNCYYNRDKIEVLPHRIYKEVSRAGLKAGIKEALKQYSGCTIYNEAGRYYIEIFTTI